MNWPQQGTDGDAKRGAQKELDEGGQEGREGQAARVVYLSDVLTWRDVRPAREEVEQSARVLRLPENTLQSKQQVWWEGTLGGMAPR